MNKITYRKEEYYLVSIYIYLNNLLKA